MCQIETAFATDFSSNACSLRSQRALEREKRARGEFPEESESGYLTSLNPYPSDEDECQDEMDDMLAPRVGAEPHRESSSILEDVLGNDEGESGDSCSEADSEGKHLSSLLDLFVGIMTRHRSRVSQSLI